MAAKISVTSRSIEDRLPKIELYFKHRYKSFNYRIGKLTEYYKFLDINVVLNDLRSMKPKVLERVELEI